MSAPLWSYEAFIAGCKGRALNMRPEEIAGISIDSRTVAPGEAFFAIAGERFDGHDFVTPALARGAATAVVAESRLITLGRVKGSLTVTLCDVSGKSLPGFGVATLTGDQLSARAAWPESR